MEETAPKYKRPQGRSSRGTIVATLILCESVSPNSVSLAAFVTINLDSHSPSQEVWLSMWPGMANEIEVEVYRSYQKSPRLFWEPHLASPFSIEDVMPGPLTTMFYPREGQKIHKPCDLIV